MADLRILADCADMSIEILPNTASRSVSAQGKLYLCPSVILRTERPSCTAKMVASNANEYRATIKEAYDLGESVFKQFCAAFSGTEEALERPDLMLRIIDQTARPRRILQSQWGKMLCLAANARMAGGETQYLPKTVEFSFSAFGASTAKFNPLQLQEAKNWVRIYLPASRRQGFQPILLHDDRKALNRQQRAAILAG